MRSESKAILRRYARRTRLYDPLDPAVYQSRQELERALIKLLCRNGMWEPGRIRVIEVGCGTGGNLLQLLRLGFRAENLVGNELQQQLASTARERLPDSTRIIQGDALDVSFPADTFDIVFQSLVFSSLLDEKFQAELAEKMWSMVGPGGGVLWYDFTFDNPSNPDVRGVPLSRVRKLFPEAVISARRVTLAPPVARLVTRIHPGLYTLFNSLFFLRTHVLCWLQKSAG